MGDQDAFERTVASLHDAMLDDSRWPGASTLIDEACGLTGNDLIVSEGPKDDVRVLFVGAYCRGQRREDQERDYLENYYPTDERVPRVCRLPDSRLVHVEDLLTAEELKTSPTYNEMLLRTGGQDSMNARLDGPDGSSIIWGLRDPVASDGWGSARIAMVEGLLPHIRQFVRVRQALVRAEARNTTVTALLDNPRVGVLHLDRRGRIIEANDRARSILRHGDGLADGNGTLRARAPADQLTRPETQVAVWLAEGKSVRDMAQATGHTERAIYWHLRQIYQKQSHLTAGGLGAVGAVARRTRMRGGAAGTSRARLAEPATVGRQAQDDKSGAGRRCRT